MKICVATVITPNFVAGALTMLHSFLQHNSWFESDIAIINGGLDEEQQLIFDNCFDNIRWISVSSHLVEKLDKLVRKFPNHIAERFYSLETFSLTGYDKILFCDSDLLFRGSIQTLFDRNETLLCCGDISHYINHTSDSKTTQPNTFNAGMFLYDKTLLNNKTYDELLAWLDVSRWKEFEPTSYNDQLVLNQQFVDSQTLLGCEYNYLLAFREIIQLQTGISLNDAQVLHFNGPIKPWRPDQALRSVQNDPAMSKAFQFWFESYCSALNKLGLRHQLKANHLLE